MKCVRNSILDCLLSSFFLGAFALSSLSPAAPSSTTTSMVLDATPIFEHGVCGST
jgi:hypothetical protein